MNLFFKTIVIGEHTGYGNASRLLKEALSVQGVTFDYDADVALNFCMPSDYEFGSYTIGYTPWESTEVPGNWKRNMKAVSDLWTTSSWTAEIFREITGRKSFILPHGIEPCWTPYHHQQPHLPFTFLHVGEPAVRKGGDIVLEAWHRRFSRDKGVKLIYKCTGWPMARIKDRKGSIVASPGKYPNIEIINSIYTQPELSELYSKVDCLVYPTRGEGFGLIPLEAMASGLPTILPNGGGTKDFARYGLPLNNYIWEHSHQNEHPGLWLNHDVDEVIAQMEYVKDNYATVAEDSYTDAFLIHAEYEWESIAKTALDRIRSMM